MAGRASSGPLIHLSAALTTKSSLQIKTYPCLQSPFRARFNTKAVDPSTEKGDSKVQKEEVVIIGAGIAGLAAAAMVHKLGIKSRVLEQADWARTGGVTLSLSGSAWKALDDIGVGDDIRRQYFQIEGLVTRTEQGRPLGAFKITNNGSLELRNVERRALLQALYDQLPPDTVQYSSRIAKIDKAETGEPLLQLTDGTRLSAEVLIGCDGIRSQVAKWMGFSEAKYAGHCAIRGLMEYSEGKTHKPVLNYYFGRGIRVGHLPVSPTKVFWFIIHNCSNPGQMITDPTQLKQKSRDLVRNLPSNILEVIDHTSNDMIIQNPLEDRWLWPGITPPASIGRVVLAGDAWHPMTPNLGQGGCTALQDAVLLSRKIHGAMRSKQESIEEALRSYGRERWPAVFKLGIKSNLVGALMQSKNPMVRFARDEFVLSRSMPVGERVEHTHFD